MSIELTSEQWADVSQQSQFPIKVTDPAHQESFVLLRAEMYDRFAALFEDVLPSDEERNYQLKQFGMRAGWDDPKMDVYNDLDPRRPS